MAIKKLSYKNSIWLVHLTKPNWAQEGWLGIDIHSKG